ncbi:ABC transporter permease [Lentilactobacillus sunkii]|uniref:ABC-2 type transporter transmembrane domain-containing protein n=1 Tax=Lentilactobacillus sunkii DSM 19904 TaxID=1423808 RepID=A0A0R1KVY9_9LACO|nr:ABC transporter permease [Lentilactobacillus sunkii]KRK87660.1 hypothetical protein FD17_GL000876 [Lentilactobacillus sunkii DSM 19904]
MFKVFKNKGIWLALLAVFAIVGVFATLQVGVKNNVQLHRVPVALVNEDTGKSAQKIDHKLRKKFTGHDSQIKWVTVMHASSLKRGFNDKRYYGALIINHHFTRNLTSQSTYVKSLIVKQKLTAVQKSGQTLSPMMKAQLALTKEHTATAPQAAPLSVKINQGMNVMVAQALTKALPAIGTALGQKISQQEQKVLAGNKIYLSTANWQAIGQPIKTNITTVNRIPNKSVSGMAPMLFIVFAWLAALVGSMLIWRVFHKTKPAGRWTIRHLTSQVLAGGLVSIVSGLSIYFFAHNCFDVVVPDASTLIWLLIGNTFVFFLIQTCVLDWAGFKGWPLIILVWISSAAVLSYAPELLPSPSRTWIYSWTPMRFSMDTITNTLYFHNGSGTMASSLWTIGIIGIVFLGILYLVVLKKDRQGLLK